MQSYPSVLKTAGKGVVVSVGFKTLLQLFIRSLTMWGKGREFQATNVIYYCE